MVTQWFSLKYNIDRLEEMTEILDKEPEVMDKPGALPFDFAAGKIEFKNVNFAYTPERPILKDVSFEVNPGETVAFVGPTGSGKSTIIQLIQRFYDLSSGTLTLDNQNIQDLDLAGVRANIGIVSQVP